MDKSITVARQVTDFVPFKVYYDLCLPKNMVWRFDHLSPGASPWTSGSYPLCQDSHEIIIPLDLITAAQLRLIKPGDDSGLEDEQWAWLKLLSLTGENT